MRVSRDERQVGDRQFASDEPLALAENRFEDREDTLDLLGVTLDSVRDLESEGFFRRELSTLR